ncbi:MAG: hypothetical protein ACXVH7_00930 [Thermoanaerobaculia bacterium]
MEVFQTGTGQVIEHSGPVSCDGCGHRWDLHSGIPAPPAEARQQPAA